MKKDKTENELSSYHNHDTDKNLNSYERELKELEEWKNILSNNYRKEFILAALKTGIKLLLPIVVEKRNKPKTTFTPSKTTFKYLLPSKRREEVMGDLYETQMDMIEEGFPLWKVKLVLYCHMFFIAFSLLKVRLMDYGRTKKQVDKD